MAYPVARVELEIWQEEGEPRSWRCRLIAPDGLHAVRLDDEAALSAYVMLQIDAFMKQTLTTAERSPGQLLEECTS